MYSVQTNVFSVTLKINTFQKLLCSMYIVCLCSLKYLILFIKIEARAYFVTELLRN